MTCNTIDVQRFFSPDAGWEILSGLQLHGSRAVLQLDFAQLHAQTSSGDLAAAMQYQPVEALGCVAAAVYEVDRPRLMSLLEPGSPVQEHELLRH